MTHPIVHRWQRLTVIFLFLGFFAISALMYGSALPRAFITLNDAELVYQNPIVVQHFSFSAVQAAFSRFDPELYIPFTFLSYQADWWLGGGSAVLFHATNVLLHTLNALLAAWLLILLSKKWWIGLLGGLLFLVHPLNAEAVLWIAARKDLLSAFFGLWTLIAYFLYLRGQRKVWLYASIVLFLFALLAKVEVILLPLLLPLADWKEERPWHASLFTEKIPYVLLSILLGIVALVGKKEVLSSSSITAKIVLSLQSAVFYLKQFFLPRNFSLYYPFLHSPSFWSTDVFISIVVSFFCIFLIFLSLRWTKDILFGGAFYLAAILPSFTNLAKGNDYLLGADRYAYLATIGLVFLCLSLGSLCWQRYGQLFGSLLIWASRIIVTSIICFLGFSAHQQTRWWQDSIAVYQHAIALSPQYYRPYYDLGIALDDKGMIDNAIIAYKKSLMLSSEYPLTYVNLGRDYYLQDQRDAARKAFGQALAKDPHFAMASFDLGIIDNEVNAYDAAKKEYESAIADDPTFLDARLNLSKMEADHGDAAAAVEQLKQALALDPHNPQTLSLAVLFLKQGIIQTDGGS